MNRSAITKFIVALSLSAVAVVALAQDKRAPFWPRLSPKAIPLTEWYADVPWHQKLGSYAGNEIIVPLILPYDALSDDIKAVCASRGFKQPQCMIEAGVRNVLAYKRIDTLYDPTDSRIAKAPECKAPNLCTEVRIEFSSYAADVNNDKTGFVLVPTTFGRRYDTGPRGDEYGGIVVTDGSTYGPQMLWEMSHYCDSGWAGNVDMQDATCYADYFSPMNNGFNAMPKKLIDDWPSAFPWSIYPLAALPAGSNQCPPGDTRCVLVLGGFNMGRVPADSTKWQEQKYNQFLYDWFNAALLNFPADQKPAELQHHFPWSGKQMTWATDIFPRAELNPFLGSYATANTYDAAKFATCDTTPTGPNDPTPGVCSKAPTYQAQAYVYPRQCTLDDLGSATAGSTSADKLRQCGLNHEIHPNGFLAQWPTDYWTALRGAPFNYSSNHYGRTQFLFAGIPGMQMPVSFFRDPTSISGLSIYEQVHNSSLFGLYLPAANIADVKRQMQGRAYTDNTFYHTLLMSNHMESDPQNFANGIRGKALWHNEYRTQPLYKARNDIGITWLPDQMFKAAFDPLKAPAPFHNHTCDGCHVRNGSGIPIKPDGTLDVALQEFMKAGVYQPFSAQNEFKKDYTFTGEIRPMKLVFFDLQTAREVPVKSSRYSQPLIATGGALDNPLQKAGGGAQYYNNKIMNFYGDSFHVSPGNTPAFNYSWYYENADPKRMVVSLARFNNELQKPYQPRQIKLESFTTPATCQIVTPSPTSKPWPENCTEINGQAILGEVSKSTVGVMLLNGKRLGNLGAIESIPNAAIKQFRADQVTKLGPLGAAMAGEIVWTSGSRGGIVDGQIKKDCANKSLTDCYIGRFGWIGDRASLEDQVANAAFVEMNITTKTGYAKLYGQTNVAAPIRYKYANCGAANKTCVDSPGNSDLTEAEVDMMADYARWLGSPTRSEVQVSQAEVIAGEKIFNNLQCNTCHVIKRINIVPDDVMLTEFFRARLKTHIGGSNQPFLSYIGTDLLMHDMGYLSQTGISATSIRDATTGIVKPGFETYVQKIRTPPLKGLRFNNYVTDAHGNVKSAGDPGCDFLLHDGRACDAIEAAFLHDGPAIKQLKVIDGLNALLGPELMALRAFLYSL